ncbi:MAG TPA: hypothetical protein VF533_16410 [Solirubrobacteraceae bacterium]|jgi:hypothetical protein
MKRRHTRAELAELLGVAEAPPVPVAVAVAPEPALEPAPWPATPEELFVMWSAARAEANLAYDAWCARPGTAGYAVYRAAEDRADAAEASLAGFAATA